MKYEKLPHFISRKNNVNNPKRSVKMKLKQPAVNFDVSCRTNGLLHPIFSTKCTPSSRPSPRFPVEFFTRSQAENLFFSQLSWQRHKGGYRSFKESELLRKSSPAKNDAPNWCIIFFWKKRMVGLLSHEIFFHISVGFMKICPKCCKSIVCFLGKYLIQTFQPILLDIDFRGFLINVM